MSLNHLLMDISSVVLIINEYGINSIYEKRLVSSIASRSHIYIYLICIYSIWIIVNNISHWYSNSIYSAMICLVHVPMNKVVLQFGIAQVVHTTPGSWFQPLWKIFVNGKDYSIYEMENKIHVWNHQPNIIMGVILWISYYTHKNILISLAFWMLMMIKLPSNEQFAMESMDFKWSTFLHFGLSISFC